MLVIQCHNLHLGRRKTVIENNNPALFPSHHFHKTCVQLVRDRTVPNKIILIENIWIVWILRYLLFRFRHLLEGWEFLSVITH